MERKKSRSPFTTPVLEFALLFSPPYYSILVIFHRGTHLCPFLELPHFTVLMNAFLHKFVKGTVLETALHKLRLLLEL